MLILTRKTGESVILVRIRLTICWMFNLALSLMLKHLPAIAVMKQLAHNIRVAIQCYPLESPGTISL